MNDSILVCKTVLDKKTVFNRKALSPGEEYQIRTREVAREMWRIGTLSAIYEDELQFRIDGSYNLSVSVSDVVSGYTAFRRRGEDWTVVEYKSDKPHQDIIPATAFLKNTISEQYRKILSENNEELEAIQAIQNYLQSGKDSDNYCEHKKAYAMELIDGQMARETALAILGYSFEEVQELRREVVAKNKVRGYYNEP